MQQIMLNLQGLSIEIRQSDGEGAPVFLFHGNSSAARAYDKVLDSPLGRTRKLIAVSWPGHGASSWSAPPEDTYTIEGLARLAPRIIRAFGADTYWLVGHSLGGHVLMQCIDKLQGAQGLLLLSSPPLSAQILAEAFLPSPCAGALFSRELDDTQTAQLARCFAHTNDSELLHVIEQNIGCTDPSFRPALGQCVMAGQMRDERALYAAADLPITLVRGGKDPFLNAAYDQSLPRRPEGRTRFIHMAHCGHSPHLEHHGFFIDLLTEMLTVSLAC